jgi:quercetin dioxygenase-like cupin family protein
VTDQQFIGRLTAEGLGPSETGAVQEWGNGPGERYGEHAHDYDKVLLVAAGSITFLVAEEAIELRAGDRLDVPAGSAHAALVGASGVRCLEAHLPARTLARLHRWSGWGEQPSSSEPQTGSTHHGVAPS